MRIWSITEALPEHIPAIAEHMREADRREVWASHRHTPLEALEFALQRSELAWTCMVDGLPSFMWGAARTGAVLGCTGAPWLLGTPAIVKVRHDFLRYCPHFVAAMQSAFPCLENYVHAENTLSIRWLKHLGFMVNEDMPELINDEDFYLFQRGAKCVNQ